MSPSGPDGPATEASGATDASDAPETAAPPTTGRARLGRNYAALFSASTISNLGDGVGMVAYPWLASAVTRNPILIAMVAVMQRLPWLLFSLPAGVITDRNDRRSLMLAANAVRATLTFAVAFVVLAERGTLPSPDEITAGAVDDDLVLYGIVVLATLLLGMAEVIYDNSAQTIMPALVPASRLETANGRLWSSEMIANTFVGPPLGAVLLAASFATPFFVDGLTFAVSAALIALLPRGSTPARTDDGGGSWVADLKEGVSWLWGHELLRPMAIILGLLNMLFTMTGAILVLFAQEVLETSPTEFALLGTGGAIGGVVGGWSAATVSRRIGSGPSLALTLVGGGATSAAIGLTSYWPVAWLMFVISTFVAVLWNVITVSLRQTIIPDRLLGRVNSVYRFFAWGMMPLGALLGGVIVAVADAVGDRSLALRLPWLLSGGAHAVLLAFAAPRLTTARIEAARAAGAEGQ